MGIHLFDDGTVYLEEGTPLPFVCPECRAIVPYSKVEVVVCRGCGRSGTSEEFSDVRWELRKTQ